MPDFKDLINIDWFEKRENFNQERWWVTFYCKDCWEEVEVLRPKKKWYVFICTKCKWRHIAIWTKEWINEKYKLKKKKKK
jgi:hypothetical protein